MTHDDENAGYSYALNTGEAAAGRLALLETVYGPDCERILAKLDILEGSAIADFGCGTGSMLPWFSRRAGPDGTVIGLDASAAQLRVAERRCAEIGMRNVSLVEADVYATGLPRNAFDVVHCRLLLCHLQRPADAIREMAEVARPGGVVACCDIDLLELGTVPRREAYERMRAIYVRRRAMDGLDDGLPAKLPQLMLSAGLVEPEMAYIQPVYFRGEAKRLWEYTFAESTERTLAKGLLTQAELDILLHDLSMVARDETVAVVQARMPVCWARKPAG